MLRFCSFLLIAFQAFSFSNLYAYSYSVGDTYNYNGMILKVVNVKGKCTDDISMTKGLHLPSKGSTHYYDDLGPMEDDIAIQCSTRSAFLKGTQLTKISINIIAAGCAAHAVYVPPAAPMVAKAAAVFLTAYATTEIVEFVIQNIPCTSKDKNPKVRRAKAEKNVISGICKLSRSKGATCNMVP